MSPLLKREIVRHIFKLFGIFSNKSLDKYALDKKLTFESEGKSYHNGLWSGEVVSEGSQVQFLIAELTEDVPEFAIIIWLEGASPYVINISTEDNDEGNFLVLSKSDDIETNNKWIDAPAIVQARVLIAIETIFDTFMTWNKNGDISTIYSYLVSFLNYESERDV